MQYSKMTSCFLIVCALALTAPAARAQAPKVEPGPTESTRVVTAYAPIVKGDTAAAREEAINRAIVLAVEQRMGFGVESKRVSVNHALVSDRIERMVKGDVARYKILSEGPVADAKGAPTDIYRVELEVTLKDEAVRDAKLDRLRLGIVPDEASNVVSDHIRDIFESQLASENIRVIPVSKTLPFNADAEEIMKFAENQTLDLVLQVSATISKRNEIGGLTLDKALVRVRLCKGATGQVLLQQTREETGERSTSSAEAGKSALSAAAKPIAGEITTALSKRERELVACHVVVANLAMRNMADIIQNHLEKSKGVSMVKLTAYKDGVARYLVECNAETARKLADYVLHVKGVDLEVLGQSWNAVVARTAPEPR